MVNAEYAGHGGCPQRDSTECKEYEGAQSECRPERKEIASPRVDMLERIVSGKNLNDAYEHVKKNKGAPGIDGMSVDDALSWFKENREAWIAGILKGSYRPLPVRRVEIPKSDGKGTRLLGIPAVRDRVLEQAVLQVLDPIFDPDFADGSFGYRPGRGQHDAVFRARGYGDDGFEWAVLMDLSKYFDTINHERLLNVLREKVKDERVIQLIKTFLKSGVMVNGVVMPTEEGSPQGSPLSPLLANIYLDEFDKEFERRGVPEIRYADDIVLFCRSKRAAERVMESATRYLETKLKLKVNREKTKVTKMNSNDFKFLGFTFGKKDGCFYIRVHPKSLEKAKRKLRMLTKRNRGRNVRDVMMSVKVYMRGWLGYYAIGAIKYIMSDWNGWLRRRLRVYIWKQWKKPKTRRRNLIKLGVPEVKAAITSGCRRGYWFISNLFTVKFAISNERLVKAGFYDLVEAFESISKDCIRRAVYRTVRTVR